MNLKQIVKKGLIVGGLLVALSGFADANFPKVSADELKSFNRDINGDYVSLGYDINQDNHEDVKFRYFIYPVEDNKDYTLAYTELDSYAVDKNKDGEFSDDEWFEPRFSSEEEVQQESVKGKLPNIHPFDLMCYETNRQNNESNLFLGYDADFDGFEELIFYYGLESERFTTLYDYAVDKNNDLEFSDDEWFEY